MLVSQAFSEAYMSHLIVYFRVIILQLANEASAVILF